MSKVNKVDSESENILNMKLYKFNNIIQSKNYLIYVLRIL